MKTGKILYLFSIALTVLFLSSCSVITGIFKAGVGVGIFLVVLVVGIILYIVNRSGGNKQ